MESSSPSPVVPDQELQEHDAEPTRITKFRIQIVDVADQKPDAVALIGGVRLPEDDLQEKGADA